MNIKFILFIHNLLLNNLSNRVLIDELTTLIGKEFNSYMNENVIRDSKIFADECAKIRAEEAAKRYSTALGVVNTYPTLFYSEQNGYGKIPTIKNLRSTFALDLRQAKNLYETVYEGKNDFNYPPDCEQ